MSSKVMRVGRKLGLVGVIFFTVKGLLWLAVPAALALLGSR